MQPPHRNRRKQIRQTILQDSPSHPKHIALINTRPQPSRPRALQRKQTLLKLRPSLPLKPNHVHQAPKKTGQTRRPTGLRVTKHDSRHPPCRTCRTPRQQQARAILCPLFKTIRHRCPLSIHPCQLGMICQSWHQTQTQVVIQASPPQTRRPRTTHQRKRRNLPAPPIKATSPMDPPRRKIVRIPERCLHRQPQKPHQTPSRLLKIPRTENKANPELLQMVNRRRRSSRSRQSQRFQNFHPVQRHPLVGLRQQIPRYLPTLCLILGQSEPTAPKPCPGLIPARQSNQTFQAIPDNPVWPTVTQLHLM